jgi:hypothetical protein
MTLRLWKLLWRPGGCCSVRALHIAPPDRRRSQALRPWGPWGGERRGWRGSAGLERATGPGTPRPVLRVRFKSVAIILTVSAPKPAVVLDKAR